MSNINRKFCSQGTKQRRHGMDTEWTLLEHPSSSANNESCKHLNQYQRDTGPRSNDDANKVNVETMQRATKASTQSSRVFRVGIIRGLVEEMKLSSQQKKLLS